MKNKIYFLKNFPANFNNPQNLPSLNLLKYFWKNKKVKLNKGRKIVPNSKLKANLPLTDQIGRGIVEKYKKIEN